MAEWAVFQTLVVAHRNRNSWATLLLDEARLANRIARN